MLIEEAGAVRYRILAYKGHAYRVGSDASVARWNSRHQEWRPIKPWINNKGRDQRLYVSFIDKKKIALHRLVLLVFRGEPPPGKPFGLHDDGNWRNNVLGNLYWGTPKENSDDSRRHGTLAIGERAGPAKLTANDVREIRRLARTTMKSELARRYQVTYQAIHAIVTRKNWAHLP